MQQNKKGFRSLLALLLIAALGLTCLPGTALAVEVNPVKPLPALTGNQAEDTAKIALSQVGYKENSAGTAYGAWWSEETGWGDYSKEAWCAMFACWCADQAGCGLNKAYNRSGALCSSLLAWQKKNATACTDFSKQPRTGDFLYFGNKKTTVDHAAIVTGYNSSTGVVSFVGGNQNDAVSKGSCHWAEGVKWGTQYVVALGRPNYNDNEFPIYYMAEGAINVPNDQIKVKGEPLIVTHVIPERGADELFIGWSLTEGADKPEYLTSGTFNIDRSLTLYAVWSRISCTGEEHEWGDEYEFKSPDCVEEGVLLTECSICGALRAAHEDPLGHETDDVVTPATCTAQGYTTHTCRVCDAVYIDSYTPLAPHRTFRTGDVEATCDTDGWTGTVECEICHAIVQENTRIEMLGHDIAYDEKVEPTCTEDGYARGKHCDRCGKQLLAMKILPAYGHEVQQDQAVMPTVTSNGLTAGSHCIACGEVLVPQQEVAALPGITLDRETVLVTAGEEFDVEAILSDNAWADSLQWMVTDAEGNVSEAVASVSPDGHVTAHAEGTAYVTALVRWEEPATKEYAESAARCRVTVTPEPEEEKDSFVLPVTSAAVKLYSTDYTSIETVFVPASRGETAGARLFDDIPSPSEDHGITIHGAYFTDPGVAALFDLRVADDRRLEIVPKYDTMRGALLGTMAVKSSYISAVSIIVLNGEGEQTFTTNNLKFSVSKALPKLKAKTLSFNPQLSGELKQVLPVTVTGGTVTALFPNEEAAAKAPSKDAALWLDVDYNAMTASLHEEITGKKSGSLYLYARVDGWAVEIPVTVSISSVPSAPKLKLAKTSASLKPGTLDSFSTTLTITPAAFALAEVTLVSVTEAGLPVPEELLHVVIDGKTVTVTAPQAPADGKLHTYKVTLQAAGKNISLTVKTYSAGSKPAVTLKASGTLEQAVPGSKVSITGTLSYFHTGTGETWMVTGITNGKREDVTERFGVEWQGNRAFLTAAKELPAGTYTAAVTADLGGGITASKAVSFTVKNSAAVVTALTVKASGTIDLIRPASGAKLAFTVKNWPDADLSRLEFIWWRKDGKVWIEDPDAPLRAVFENGMWYIRADESLTTSVKYAVSAVLDDGSLRCESGKAALSVKMGSASVKSSIKSGTIYRKDPDDRVEFTLVPGAGLSEIRDVQLDSASARYYRLIPLEGGGYALAWKDAETAASFRAGTSKTARINVWLEGNPGTKINAAVSIRLTAR